MGEKTEALKALGSKTKDTVWTYKQFFAIAMLLSVMGGVVLKIQADAREQDQTAQTNAREELRADFEERFEAQEAASNAQVQTLVNVAETMSEGWENCREELGNCYKAALERAWSDFSDPELSAPNESPPSTNGGTHVDP